jgi:hypothetical protein
MEVQRLENEVVYSIEGDIGAEMLDVVGIAQRAFRTSSVDVVNRSRIGDRRHSMLAHRAEFDVIVKGGGGFKLGKLYVTRWRAWGSDSWNMRVAFVTEDVDSVLVKAYARKCLDRVARVIEQ